MESRGSSPPYALQVGESSTHGLATSSSSGARPSILLATPQTEAGSRRETAHPRDGSPSLPPHARVALAPTSPTMRRSQSDLGDATRERMGLAAESAEEERADGSARKRLRLDDAGKAESSRLRVLRAEADSEPGSPSTSRQSSPSLQSPTASGPGFGGAKRRGDDEVPLPRNIDRVYFGDYNIRTWYHSPYPLEDDRGTGSSTHPNGHATHRSASTSRSKARPRQSNAKGSGSKGRSDSASPSVTGAGRNGEGPSASRDSPSATDPEHVPKTPALWICEGCLKYMKTHAGWYAHRKICTQKHPPGRKVYQRGSHTIWEVDGAEQKLYAQNLSLLGKLFIDHKTIFFDVEPFLFYIVTDTSANFDYVLGYFSKEKVSYDDYNLACIITFPPFQKKGFGTLMIEFSYYLSTRASIVGTPERPLSELGFKGYLSFWVAVVLRALALAFNEDDPEVSSRLLPQATSSSSPYKNASLGPSSSSAQVSKTQKKAAVQVRAVLLGLADKVELQQPLLDSELTEEEISELRKAKRAARGFGRDLPPALASKLAAYSPPRKGSRRLGLREEVETWDEDGSREHATEPEAASTSTAEAVPAGDDGSDNEDTQQSARPARKRLPPRRVGPDRAARHATSPSGTNSAASVTGSTAGAAGSDASSAKKEADEHAPLHAALNLDNDATNPFALGTTLERISQATNLRPEDAAFALSECGLLKWRLPSMPESLAVEGGNSSETSLPNGGGGGGGGSDSSGSGKGKAPMQHSLRRSARSESTSTPDPPPPPPPSEAGPGPFILITREAVKKAILQRGIKRPVLDLEYVFS